MATKDLESRLNNITGQLNGVKKMLGEESYPYDVILQLKAARSGIDSLIKEYATKELTNCLSLSLEQKGVCDKFLKAISQVI